jgi:hypothetical protein
MPPPARPASCPPGSGRTHLIHNGQVGFNPRRVQAFRLIGYENRVLAHQDFNDETGARADFLRLVEETKSLSRE